MKNPSMATIGLLPLFLSLYDEAVPQLRTAQEPFRRQVAAAFRSDGFRVHEAPVCCVESEFESALREIEAQGADLIVTLHLAYSPSLEAAGLLARSPLPILMLDTTPDAGFGPDVDPERILYNHGIHGVQDLSSMLRRLGKVCHIVAGHLSDPAVIERAGQVVRAAHAAACLKGQRVLRIGPAFKGMGDFQVSNDLLRETFDTSIDTIWPQSLAPLAASITDEDIKREMDDNREGFVVDLPDEVHRRSARLGLCLRRHLDACGCDAFSMNFSAFDSAEGPVCTVPFLECCLAMSRGIGYAGEGDILTALLVGAMQRSYGSTTFTEIFCPDWQGQCLFLSHMGEFNPQLAAGRPRLFEKDFPFTPALNPAAIACAPRPGPATLVNLAPGPGGTFSLIVCPVEILEDGHHPDLKNWLRAWVRPSRPVGEFLEAYSALGGTHHSALILGEHGESLIAFAGMAGLEGHLID